MKSALIISLVALQATSVSAQGRIADEGSFTISLNGRTAGRENFRITATTRGDVMEYLARADVTYGDRKVTPELRTAMDGAVVVYNVITKAGATSESWEGAVARGRLNAKIATGRGTSVREYVLPAGALLLDDEVIHQHWFLTLRVRDAGLPVVVPRASDARSTVTVSTVGEDRQRIGNHDLPATHLRVTVGADVHDVWVDKSGRLLKVAIPSKGLVAVRDDPPPA